MIAATTYTGMEYSKNLHKRIWQLNDLKKIMLNLYGDVEYGGCTLAESFERIAKKQEPPFQTFLNTLCIKMKKEKGMPFEMIFEGAVNETLQTSALRIKDKENLTRLGRQLGNTQRNSQLRTIQIYLEELEQLIQELEKEKQEKQKLGRILGISSGVLIVILLL